MGPDDKSFGVFKPVGHLVISFPGVDPATATVLALRAAGVAAEDIRRYTDRQMLEQIDEDLAHASPLAQVGQEYNLVRAHRELAAQGYHFLVVRVPDHLKPSALAEMARNNGALRAQMYGTFIIEELIERPGQHTQVAESPDRGFDAQTRSGQEAEAGAEHRRRVEQQDPPGG